MIKQMVSWTKIAGFPTYPSGWIRDNIITVSRSIKDLNEDGTRMIQDNFLVSSVSSELKRLPQINIDVQKPVAMDLSPSGMFTLILRNNKDEKPLIEVNSNMGNCLKIDASDHHGKVLGDGWFSGISWSEGEKYAAYVSCSKKKFKKSSYLETEGDAESRGTKFEFQDDWGEKYEGVGPTCINIINTLTGKIITAVDGGDASSVGQPVIRYHAESGRYTLFYTAWTTQLKRLGLIYCYQRPCSIYSLDITSMLDGTSESAAADPKAVCLSKSCALARSPRISPSGNTLVFIGRQQPMTTHNGCFQLFSLDVSRSSASPTVHVDIVSSSSDNDEFPGLFADQLPRQPFLSETKLLFNSLWGSRDSVCLIDLVSPSAKRVERLPLATLLGAQGTSGDAEWNKSEDASCSLLDIDASSQSVLFVTSSPVSPPRLGLYDVSSRTVRMGPAPTASSIALRAEDGADRESAEASLAGMRWTIIPHRVEDAHFESILLLPTAPSDASIPLVAVPHGGPHSCTPTTFMAAYAFLALQLNSAILYVNYRGSTGFGQSSIDSLPGKIGRNDVDDMMQAINDAAAAYPFLDKDRMAVVGGSHGGFLTAHLIGQFPTTFKAAAMRNPVTNIPSMFGVTDIPDWTVVESGYPYDFSNYNVTSSEVLGAMLAASPVRYVDAVRTPTLMCLGGKDRRVPPSQGMDYYHLLKARSVPCKMLVFPEDTHAIDRPASEAEHFVAIALWFEKYCTPFFTKCQKELS